MIIKTKIYIAMAVLLFLGACKRNQIETQDNSKKPQNKEHGRGAILDREAYLKVPEVNVEELIASLQAKGVKPKFQLNVPGKRVDAISPNPAPPSSVILLHPAIGNQLETGTCVSWSVGYAAKQILDMTWQSSTADAGQRSGWYIYNRIYAAGLSGYSCSINDSPPNGGYGLNTAVGLNCAKNYGVASVSKQPSYAACSPAPTTAANTSASTDKIASYATVSNYFEIKQLLAAGLPVVYSFAYYNDFQTAFDYHTTWSTTNSPATGSGHSVCFIGYDDSKAAFLLQNSWGTGGGDSTYPGCMWVSYSLINTMLAQGRSNGGAEAYVVQPFSSTPVNSFYNTQQVGVFYPSCSVGIGSGQVTFTVPANTYSSPVSVAAANALARNYIDNNGQNYANQNGTCTPATVSINLTRSNSISGTYSIEFNGAPGVFQKPFNTGTVTVPAGKYTVSIFPIGGSTISRSFSGSSCTMSYSNFGTSVSFTNVLLNCGTSGASFAINP
ncbi:C1 family peptidase [Mucilaginibacter sp. UR6-1]|uniref:DUF5977 domain-containing protein n=1 Tax=Mucilaginibacter sp. UR6-1 TaxID=1435643 RepID=UPI001E4E587E|nr:DUF5977 domain-containing protein [Mucilaginibacter sp. UR6-1]MCC8409722.1 C1 family peptidase [Mucilaginibacter sp. UR6-1]